MISVRIMEPDPMVSNILGGYVRRLSGFSMENPVRTLKEADAATQPVNLFLAELNFPDGDFLAWLQDYYKAGGTADFIPVTGDCEYASYMRSFRMGAVDYIQKPFSQERIRRALLRYQDWKNALLPDQPVGQPVLDRFYFAKKFSGNSQDDLLSGGSAATKRRVEAYIRELQGKGFTLVEASEALGMSKVTVRRYLDQLYAEERITTESSYGRVGRPVITYREVDN